MKDAKKKFAIIGTSSSGKTTLTYDILARLKKLGIHCDGVVQQDRRIAFDRDKLETEPEAQFWVIFNQLIKECELLLKDGTDVLVSDRSVIDFYAYYETMYGRNTTMFEFLKWWASTYDGLYYLNPLKYDDDGSRPSDEFRMRVDETLQEIITETPEVIIIDREDIYASILSKIDRILTHEELCMIPKVLGQKCLLGGSYAFNRQTKQSDVDIYLLGDEYVNSQPELEQRLKNVFGGQFEVRTVKKDAWDHLLDQGFKLFTVETQGNVK